MCDFQGKWIAFLDNELSPQESASLEHHLEECMECQRQLEVYKQVSCAFDVACDSVMAEKIQYRIPLWVPALTGAVVALLALFLLLPSSRVEPPAVRAPSAVTVSYIEPGPAPRKSIRQRHAIRSDRKRPASWRPGEPAIQVAIPAEAMFPPGAVPAGMNFIAEVSISPDGSVDGLRLRP